MKKLQTVVVVFLFWMTLHAQNDTMYVMRDNVVLFKYKVTNIDSIVFKSPVVYPNTVVDVEGNIYNTVTIVNKIWMKENLRVTKYADGTPIENVISLWDNLTETSKAYCWYNNDINFKNTYGALYTWAAAMNGAASNTSVPGTVQGVCPTGWHIPTYAEFKAFRDSLVVNGFNYDETKIVDKTAKSLAAASGWFPSSTVGAAGNVDFSLKRNATGFSAIPSGLRGENGVFGYKDKACFLWTATDFTAGAYNMFIDYSQTGFIDNYSAKKIGFSVRCVKN